MLETGSEWDRLAGGFTARIQNTKILLSKLRMQYDLKAGDGQGDGRRGDVLRSFDSRSHDPSASELRR